MLKCLVFVQTVEGTIAFAMSSAVGAWGLLTYMQGLMGTAEHDWLSAEAWRFVLLASTAGSFAETIPTRIGNLDNVLIPVSTALVGLPWIWHLL